MCHNWKNGSLLLKKNISQFEKQITDKKFHTYKNESHFKKMCHIGKNEPHLKNVS